MSMRARAGLLAGLLLAGVAPALQAQAVMTGAEIKEQWIGKEVLGRARNGARVVMTMNTDGSAKLLVGAVPHEGSWRPWEQGYCATWNGLRNNQEMCFTVKRDGDKFQVYLPDGASAGALEVK